MALVLKDRVKETTTTTGTGTITLAGAVAGFQSFSVIGNANTCYYAIVGPTEWEVGIGTYTSSGTTLSRDTILESSNGGTAVSFSAGAKDVFVTYPAERAVNTADIGVSVQAYDAGLQSIAGLTTTADRTIYTTASDTYAVTTLTSFGRSLIDDADAAAGRTTLGATTVGSNVFTLTNPSAITFPRFNADNTVSALTATDFRTAIGAGTGNGTVTSVSWTGGIVSVATGTTTPAFTIAGTSGGIPYFSSASTWATSAALAANALVVGGGAGVAPSTVTTGTGVVTALGIAVNSGAGGLVTNTGTATLTNKTLTDPALIGTVTEDIFTITDAAGFQIDPANGSIQTITLGANRTPAATNFTNGKIVLLGINDGTAYTITWTTVAVTWVKAGGLASAPTLSTSGFTWVLLWEVGGVVYGCEVGQP